MSMDRKNQLDKLNRRYKNRLDMLKKRHIEQRHQRPVVQKLISLIRPTACL
jgi:hypothetical protein